MDLAIIADDLTGAADTAAPFVSRGAAIHVALDARHLSGGAVVALDTATRDLPPEQAAAAVAAAVGVLSRQAPARWFKKLDSLLRGNVAAEVAAFTAALHPATLLVAPAYPRQGRLTIGGSQLVNSRPATGDAATSSVVALLAAALPVARAPLETVRDAGALVLAVREAAGGALVCDAATDADLDALVAAAKAYQGGVAFAGSAGLAEALARALSGSGGAGTDGPAGPASPAMNSMPPPDAPALLLVGSLHPVSRRQLATLGQDSRQAAIFLTLGSESSGPLAEAAALAMRRAGFAVVATENARSPIASSTVARALAALGAELVTRRDVRRVFVTGGEVARALCDMLVIRALEVTGVVEDGVPIMIALDGVSGLTMVTKAGGFGDDQTLCRVATYLSGRTVTK